MSLMGDKKRESEETPRQSLPSLEWGQQRFHCTLKTWWLEGNCATVSLKNFEIVIFILIHVCFYTLSANSWHSREMQCPAVKINTTGKFIEKICGWIYQNYRLFLCFFSVFSLFSWHFMETWVYLYHCLSST